MYVDGWMLLAIYVISVLALGVSVYALWSLEEIRLYYKKYYSSKRTVHVVKVKEQPKPKPKGLWD